VATAESSSRIRRVLDTLIWSGTMGVAHVEGLVVGHWARQAVEAAWYQAIG
jgi:hypothetical protein